MYSYEHDDRKCSELKRQKKYNTIQSSGRQAGRQISIDVKITKLLFSVVLFLFFSFHILHDGSFLCTLTFLILYCTLFIYCGMYINMPLRPSHRRRRPNGIHSCLDSYLLLSLTFFVALHTFPVHSHSLSPTRCVVKVLIIISIVFTLSIYSIIAR